MTLKAWTGREYAALGAVVVTLATLLGGGWLLQSRNNAASAAAPAGDAAEAFTVPAQGDGDLPAADSDEPLPAAETPPNPAPASPAPSKLVVFVSGAVKRPGVYTLRPGDRVYHAVRAAGGFKANAREDVLNQAAEVQDQDQINIPTRAMVAQHQSASAAGRASSSYSSPRVSPGRTTTLPVFVPLPSRRAGGTSSPAPSVAAPVATVIPGGRGGPVSERGRVLGVPPVPVVGGEAVEVASAGGGGTETASPSGGEGGAGGEELFAPKTSRSTAGSSAKFRNPGDGAVGLNSATSAELQKLPGVGPSTAAKILDYRKQIGRFTDPKQLQDVKGIGEKKYAKMQPFLTLD